MAEPFIGEIRLFAGSFVPRGWALCDGRTIAVRDNPQLFSILQARFGGDGRNTFALPDLRDRVGVHRGRGARLTDRPHASAGGSATVAININEMPSHTHRAQGSSAASGTVGAPKDRVWGRTNVNMYKAPPASVPMRGDALAPEGNGGPHNNLQPFLVLAYIIALTGVYPMRG